MASASDTIVREGEIRSRLLSETARGCPPAGLSEYRQPNWYRLILSMPRNVQNLANAIIPSEGSWTYALYIAS